MCGKTVVPVFRKLEKSYGISLNSDLKSRKRQNAASTCTVWENTYSIEYILKWI